MTRDDLRAALAHPNVAAFLRVIRAGESSQTDDAYRMRYGGHGQKPKRFDSFDAHPRIFEPRADGRESSAAGAYQATWTTWREELAKYGWPDFSPASQDEFAVARLVFRKALDAVIAGRFEEACRLCHDEWTSLPGGDEENAATRHARETYIRWGGRFSEQPEAAPAFDPDSLATEHYDGPEPYRYTPPTGGTMPLPLAPIAIAAAQAFLPRLIDLIPALGAALGSGSEVQKRNVAAATMVAQAVQDTVQAPNLQAAIERMESDPEALAAARAAVTSILPTLVEAGGGGIKGAREASASQSGDWRKLVFSLPFVGILAFVPTIWAVVAAAVFDASWLLKMDAQMRGTVIGFVMGTIAGGIVMYVYGASMTKRATFNQPE